MLGRIILSLAFLAVNFRFGRSVGPPPSPFAIFDVCDDLPCDSEDHWGGVCATGRAQSPINLESGAANSYRQLRTDNSYRLSHLYGSQNLRFSRFGMQNTGHDVQITFPGQSVPVLHDPFYPAGNNSYAFVQAHFHWGPANNGSEHAINIQKYAGEMHIVHYATKYENFERALEAESDPESLLVVGILLKLSPRSNLNLAPIVRTLRQIKAYDWTLPVHGVDDQLDLANFFPRNLDFFRYHGSLTVPGCNEQVLWLVHKDPIPISLTQIRQFYQVEDYKGMKVTENWRSVQPRYNRAIQYYHVQIRK